MASKLKGLRVKRSRRGARPGYIISGTQRKIKMAVLAEVREVCLPSPATRLQSLLEHALYLDHGWVRDHYSGLLNAS